MRKFRRIAEEDIVIPTENNVDNNETVTEHEQENVIEVANDENNIADSEQVEVVNETVTEHEQENVIEKTSDETEPVVETVSENNELTLTDDLVFQYLSNKLNKEINTIDDLVIEKNALNDDPYLTELINWRKKTNRPIEDWVKFQKDYDSYSDMEVAEEFLKLQFPHFTNDEINLELSKYVPSDEEFSEMDNKFKALELKKYASLGREELNKIKGNLDLPNTQIYDDNVKNDIEYAKQVRENINNQQEQYNKYMKDIVNVSNQTDKLKINLPNDMTVDFNVPNDLKQNLPNLINEMPHWKNADGSWNHNAVVQDAIKINNFNELLELAFNQGLNVGKEQQIKENNNITIGNPSPTENENNNNLPVLETPIRRSRKFGFKQ